jgi:hypothetical protein
MRQQNVKSPDANTAEMPRPLAARGVPTRLLVGPWAHLDVPAKGAAATISESLAWLDRYAGPGKNGPGKNGPARTGPGPASHPDHSVRIWVGGDGAGEHARRDLGQAAHRNGIPPAF